MLVKGATGDKQLHDPAVKTLYFDMIHSIKIISQRTHDEKNNVIITSRLRRDDVLRL